MSSAARKAFLASVEAGRPDLKLLAELADCHYVVPAAVCDMLAVTRGSTYAQAAALLQAREEGRHPD